VLLAATDTPAHSATEFFASMAAHLGRHGIQLTSAITPGQAIAADTLRNYDAVLLFGDQASLTADEQRAIAGFVDGGKGVVGVHASGAPAGPLADLLGGPLRAADAGSFTAQVVSSGDPAVQGLSALAGTGEVFVPDGAAAGRTVLLQTPAGGGLPVAWTRTPGQGRVFYVGAGHDGKTWSEPAFGQLVENGVLYAVDQAARQAHAALQMPEVKYAEGFNVPNYEQRDPAPRYQMPLTPAESMKFVQIPPDFTLQLFASEPDIVKPITFAFDERGRMWIIEALNYPNNVLNGAPGDDRIKILEDTDGDGRADKFTVFAEHLNLATSLAFANGGVVVAAAPDMLFLKDTDGDGKADVRQVLSTGWGIRDTHAGPSNLQYGMDNRIWGTVGYSGYNGEMNGKPLQFTQGAYRFKPDGSDFEYMTMSTNNTWGLGFSETFDVFGSTANNDPSWYLAIPNRFFEGVQGLPAGRGSGPGYQSAAQFYAAHYATPYIRQVDVWGGYTAGSGHYLYTARAFPKPYWNRVAFISEPTAHIVGQGVLESDGGGFVTRDGWTLLAGSEEWVSPVLAQVGPDGAVWVADWYNFINQHNPTPPGYSNGPGNAYETSMRDHSRGRIYRIAWKGAPAAERPQPLSTNDRAGLLRALASDNMFWRLTAQRLLVERGQKDVVPDLIGLVKNTAVDAVGINGGAMHALWTLQGLGELGGNDTPAAAAAVQALKHPAAGVRKAAAMVLPKTAASATAILSAGLLHDPDLHTRMAAVLAVAELPDAPGLAKALYTESQKPENFGDRWLSRAFYIAATKHKDAFLTEYRSDPAKLPYSGLPVSIRIGDTRPDWRAPSAADLAAEWKDMEVPGAWETHGLPDFDGAVWFTKTFDARDVPASLSLGRIASMGDVWVNGLSVQFAPAPPGANGRGGPGGGRGNARYVLPPGTLKDGQNTITVRIQNFRGDGGFLGTPDQMFIESAGRQTPLAGTWKYRVERQTNAGTLYTKAGQLAAHVAFEADGGAAGAAGSGLKPVAPPAPDVTFRLSVKEGELKFDLSEMTAAPGQLIEIVFTNPDQMQHNFVLGQSGSLQLLGAAADEVAKSPNALAQQYVPDVPQVIYSTRLLDPGQTVTFQFRAPAQTGAYPYVCTFPGHWRTMNGVLNVVAPTGRGGRGRGGA
jgi:putative membrane-bound dehydrogenase-like protein